jgi:phosphatidylglycerol:prolipoprotein diacylglycerol transferase
VDVFKIWNGGLAIYGGLIGGLLGVFIYSVFAKKRFLSLADVLIPSLILGQAIGRWGNFVNQEAYGWVIKNPAWTFFPAAVFIKAEGNFHMATFFYESMWDFGIFAFLMNYLKKNRREGNVFFFYLALYGFGRMIIEGFRMDSQILFNTGLRVNQLISAVFMVFGILMLLLRKNARIVESFKVPLFPESEKQQQKKMERAEKEAKASDLSNVSDDLKLMDDDARMKRIKGRVEEHEAPDKDDTEKPE